MIDRHLLRLRSKAALSSVTTALTIARNTLYFPLWRHQALRRRRKLIGDYIMVMGSCGKSTATMLAGALLDRQRPTGTGLFYNNERWALRKLRQWTRPVDIFVQELSEYPPGTIASISRTMTPRGALVTAIGLDHRTAFRTHQAVIDEMLPLVRALPPGGFLCLNADDPDVRSLADHCPAPIFLFGQASDARLRVENVRCSLGERLRFDLVEGDRRRSVTTRFVGRLMLPSIIGALAIVRAMDGDLDAAIADLAHLEPLKDRMGVIAGRDGHTYVMDTYKASLWSTRLLVDDIPNITASDRILVLGALSDMASENSRKYRQVIRQASDICTLVVATGEAIPHAESLIRAEPKRTNIRTAGNFAAARSLLRGLPAAAVIVKGKTLQGAVRAVEQG